MFLTYMNLCTLPMDAISLLSKGEIRPLKCNQNNVEKESKNWQSKIFPKKFTFLRIKINGYIYRNSKIRWKILALQRIYIYIEL